jgi:hypothetical protein
MVDPALERDVDPQQQIRQVARMIRRAWLAILTCVGAGAMVGVALWFFLPRSYLSTYKVLMRSDWMFNAPGMQRTLADLPWPTRARLLEDQLRSTAYLRKALDKVEWAEWARAKGRGEDPAFVLKVKEKVAVRPTPAETGERFLLINFTWNEPRAAADFCKALFETWIGDAMSSYADEVNRQVSLAAQTQQSKDEALGDAERSLEQFEIRNGISALNQNQNLQQRADGFRNDLDLLSRDIANWEARIEAMDQDLAATDTDGKPLYPPTLAGTGTVNNPEKQAHIDQMLALLQEIEDLRLRSFTEKWRPYAVAMEKLKILVAATSELENTVDLDADALPNPEYVARKAARDQVYFELQGMYAAQVKMANDLAELDKRLETLPEVLRQHSSLQADVALARQISVAQKLENEPLKDKQLALKGQLNPYQKLEEPVPARSPTTAVGWLALVVSTILGLGVAIAFVVGKELLRSSFTSADQARRTLRLPVLGEVAQIQTVPEVRRARLVRLVQIAASLTLLAGFGAAIWVCVAHPEDLPRGLVEWAQGLREALS